MGLDLPQGSGWRIGGPPVQPADANQSLAITVDSVRGGERWQRDLTGRRVDAIVAVSDDGRRVRIAPPASGPATWQAPDGRWTVYVAGTRFSGDNVKRPAPGGAGPALDPFSAAATERYLRMFADRTAAWPRGTIRSYFHDSFEYTGNGSAELFPFFRTRRGYDLADELPALAGRGDTDARRARTVGLPADARRDAPREFRRAADALVARARRADARAGARLTRQPARSLRGVRHPRDGDLRRARQPGRRSDDQQVRVVRRARRGEAARVGGVVHLAGRALHRHARAHEGGGGQDVPRRHQPSRLPRHGVLAVSGGVARLAVLRFDGDQPAQRDLARSPQRSTATSRACSPRCRRGSPTPTSCCTGRSGTTGTTRRAGGWISACTIRSGSTTSRSASSRGRCT